MRKAYSCGGRIYRVYLFVHACLPISALKNILTFYVIICIRYKEL